MSTTTIKLQFNDDIRRVPVEKDKLTYQDLLAKIASIYKTIPERDQNRIVVRYLDNESDMCTITSNEELQEAFCSFSTTNLVLKLVITLQEAKKIDPAKECPWKFGKGMCQFRKLSHEGIALMHESKFEEARTHFLNQLKEAKNEWQQRIPCYFLACVESLIGNTSTALEYLEKAVNLGFWNLRKLKEDPNLNAIRSFDKFQQLVNTVAQKKESKCGEERAELRKKFTEEWKNRDPHCEAFSERRKCHWKKFLKNNCSPVVVEEKPQEKEVSPIVIEKPVEKLAVEIAPIVIEKPVVPHKYEKTLAMFEEMGFLNREKNIEALDKAKGDAKLAVSVLLGL